MEQKIVALVQPTLEGMGYALVRILIQGKGRCILQVMAERQDRAAMNIDDCASLSRAVSAVLDVADLIQGPYVLEVTSPGLDRPLTKPEDFARFAGYEMRLETWRSITGRRRFRGRLLGLSAEGAVHLTLSEGGEVVIPQAEVAKAKLVLTDERVAVRPKAVTAQRKEREP
ncbi:FIG000325: clustered with transcription termination protein NusA [invertebrate metagenome]|uniref:FIG000325: clustered with transcription termination protein NusA n=1 Tax=invertebrate metagenome TaxID=1711999 RepID=A0A484H971_9ZZZZ